MKLLGLAAISGLVVSASPAWAIDVVSRFDSGTDGWTLEGPGTLEWVAAGGHNGGGGLKVTRTGPGEVYLVAPPAFNGNWAPPASQFPVGKLTFNYYNFGPYSQSSRPLRIEATGSAGSAQNDSFTSPQSIYQNAWSAILVGLTPSPVFTNITGVKIRLGLDPAMPVGEVFLIDDIGFKTCPANCDGSTNSPILTNNDFQCFLNAFARRDASCSVAGYGRLSAEDFQGYLNNYAAGCPYP